MTSMEPKHLTQTVQRVLVARAQEGDKSAREQLILTNTGWIRKEADKLALNADDYEDVVQSGFIGLMECVDTYDITSKSTFLGWSVPRIKFRMQEQFRQRFYLSVPRSVAIDTRQIGAIRDNLLNTLGREPTKEEIVSAFNSRRTSSFITGSPGDRALEVRDTGWMHLDGPAGTHDDDTDSLYSFLPDANVKNPLDLLIEQEERFEQEVHELRQNVTLKDTVRQLLSERDAEIICLLFGLDGVKYTTQEVADMFSMEHSTVKRIKTHSLRRIRERAPELLDKVQ